MDETLAAEAQEYLEAFEKLQSYSLPVQPVASFYSDGERKLQVFCSPFEGEESRDARLGEVFVLMGICGFSRLVFSTDSFLSDSDMEGLLHISMPLDMTEPIYLMMRGYTRLPQGVSFELPTYQELNYDNATHPLIKIMKTALDLPMAKRKWHLTYGFASWILSHRGHVVAEQSNAPV